jgi:hypothetical protein
MFQTLRNIGFFLSRSVGHGQCVLDYASLFFYFAGPWVWEGSPIVGA